MCAVQILRYGLFWKEHREIKPPQLERAETSCQLPCSELSTGVYKCCKGSVFSETAECSKGWKNSLLRMVILMYCVSKVSVVLGLDILGKGKHIYAIILLLESLKKSNLNRYIYLMLKKVISSLPRQRVTHLKDLRWLYPGLMEKSVF